MTAPLHLTRATKICLVPDGEGYLEMVCPHVSSSWHRGRSHSRGRKGSPSYHRFSAPLRPGMVFVVPAGHPFLVGASKQNNLHAICFEVNARGNKMLTLAGTHVLMKLILVNYYSTICYHI